MGIIKQYDKRTGITYVYESKAYWDKEKQMSRAKRTLIGKLDPETGKYEGNSYISSNHTADMVSLKYSGIRISFTRTYKKK